MCQSLRELFIVTFAFLHCVALLYLHQHVRIYSAFGPTCWRLACAKSKTSTIYGVRLRLRPAKTATLVFLHKDS